MSPAIPLEEAVSAVVASCAPLPSERIGTDDAAGRILAEDVASPIDLPPFANSAMDGYAVRSADTANAPVVLPVSDESRAGFPVDGPIREGTAIRISTGAVMPDGADAVARVEEVELGDGSISISQALIPGHDVRPAGDDISAGAIVLKSGAALRAGELAMLASVGRTEVEVREFPRVAVISTGDELASPGSELQPGQIYDSNGSMLAQLVTDSGGSVESLVSRVADSRHAVDAAIDSGIRDVDVLIVCGGVSMGEHDHVKAALIASGVEQVFWQVAMRPGHPTWFGTRPSSGGRSTLVFGLPGNPVSSYVTFHLFVRPALAALLGDIHAPLTVDAKYQGPRQHKRSGFVHALRCRLGNQDGEIVASLTAENQRSHALTSAVGVDALALLPEDMETLDDGDRVRVRMIRS